MLSISDRSGVFPGFAGRRPARSHVRRLLRIAAARTARLLAPWRHRLAAPAARELDEVGDATLRDLGLLDAYRGTPYDLADIDAGLESTRMRLFAMTGQYWRGS
jgi:hypothetical protein